MNALTFIQDLAGMLEWDKPDTLVGPDKELALVIQATNDVLRHVQDDKEWQELSVSGHLLIDPIFSATGTIAAAYGSSTLTCTGGPFVAGHVGKSLFVSGTKVKYTITAVDSTTQVTLDRAWSEADFSATGTLYIGTDTYELPADFDRFSVSKLYIPAKDTYVEVVGKDELNVERQKNGLGMPLRVPVKCTIWGLSTDGTQRKIHFDSFSEEALELEFDYQKKHPTISGNSDVVLYPDKVHLYLKDMIIARVKRDAELSPVSQKIYDDARAEREKTLQAHDSGQVPVRIQFQTRSLGKRRRRFRSG